MPGTLHRLAVVVCGRWDSRYALRATCPCAGHRGTLAKKSAGFDRAKVALDAIFRLDDADLDMVSQAKSRFVEK